MDNPTTAQVYDFIRSYIEKHQISPSYREIAEGCFISPSTVESHLLRLEVANLIHRIPNVARSIQLIDDSKN